MNFVLRFKRDLSEGEKLLVDRVMRQVLEQLASRERIPWESVASEMDRQVEKWDRQDHPDRIWLAILVEEVGEVAKALLEGGAEDVEEEVVQCAAVALSWLESMAAVYRI